jgi:glutamyl-tRNA(Gln) amidotransferase subunit D
MIAATRLAAQGPIAESVIVMHSSPSDDHAYALRGVRARKMHTSRRDAFLPVNDLPLARISREGIELISKNFRRREEGVSKVHLDDRIDERVALIQVWPGIPQGFLSSLEGIFRGIVIAGTGLGHVPKYIIPEIRELIRKGVPVVISSQCLYGRVDLKVYETGRRLLEVGVIPAMDMLPEVALVKLMFVLGHTDDLDEVRTLMLTNLAGELGAHLGLNTFPPCWG